MTKDQRSFSNGDSWVAPPQAQPPTAELTEAIRLINFGRDSKIPVSESAKTLAEILEFSEGGLTDIIWGPEK